MLLGWNTSSSTLKLKLRGYRRQSQLAVAVRIARRYGQCRFSGLHLRHHKSPAKAALGAWRAHDPGGLSQRCGPHTGVVAKANIRSATIRA